MSLDTNEFVSFVGDQRTCRGTIEDVALACKARLQANETQSMAIYSVDTGELIDVDFRGDNSQVLERLRARFPKAETDPEETEAGSRPKPRGRGRPRLGVVSREISLLPRHWQWLAEQRGGASASVRRLVEAAIKGDAGKTQARQAINAAHNFMWDIAGNLENFEEAARSLFASDFHRFEELIVDWPADIRGQLKRYVDLATQDDDSPGKASG